MSNPASFAIRILCLIIALGAFLTAGDAPTPATATVTPGSSTATVSFGQVLSENGGTLRLEVRAGAGAEFVVGSAQASSGGSETWGKITDTPNLVVFEAALPNGAQRKTYRPSFNGTFKVTGNAPGKPPTWAVSGSYAVNCSHVAGRAEASGGTSAISITEAHDADAPYTVHCALRKADGSANTSTELWNALRQPPGKTVMAELTIAPSDIVYAPAQAPSSGLGTCPVCHSPTLVTVVATKAITGAGHWHYELPDWAELANAGDVTKWNWSNDFLAHLATHESGHHDRYLSHFITPAAADYAGYGAKKYVGEACCDPQQGAAGITAAYEAAKLKAAQALNDELTNANAAVRALWTTHNTVQNDYDTQTNHGATQGAILVTGVNLND